jgi:hypothetical protein
MDWETDRGLQLRISLAVGLVPVAFVFAFDTVGVDLLASPTARPRRSR